MSQKVVICGAGFLGSNIAKAIIHAPAANCKATRRVQISSRHPEKIHHSLQVSLDSDVAADHILEPVPIDITNPSTLPPAFQHANVVVSLVGILYGKNADFERIQWHGADNVAKAAQAVGAKLIHISAIGADEHSEIPYARTKGLGEKAVMEACPSATIIRPSIIFGPGDSFFTRFAKMSALQPFMPAVGGGYTNFQPVYVGDIARAVEIISRDDPEIRKLVDGKIIEAGGPDVMSLREILEATLHYKKRWRPVVPVPFFVATLQASILEHLPQNLFTITRDQVKQLKIDNVVNPSPPPNYVSFKDLLEKYSGQSLSCVHDILPKYI
ncbi:NAD(P)-binding protein [Abortiporus biennis]|nr:NAD(P)-binding protein [Abortiporus biennis]